MLAGGKRVVVGGVRGRGERCRFFFLLFGLALPRKRRAVRGAHGCGAPRPLSPRHALKAGAGDGEGESGGGGPGPGGAPEGVFLLCEGWR